MMRRKVRIIATDLDGTLLNSEKKISPRTYAALEQAAAAGIEIVPVTGRLMSAVPEAVRQLPFLRYIIAINGAQVVELATGRIIYKAEIPCNRALEVLDGMDSQPAIYDCYIDGHGWMSEKMYRQVATYATNPHMLELFYKFRTPVPDLKEYLRQQGKSVQKLQMHFLTAQQRMEAQPRLEALWRDLAVSSSFETNIEVNCLDATKGAALRFLCDYLGIDIAQCMSFGDGSNDITMLKAAGIGVAMGNAMEEVKRSADIIAASCDEDGMAQILEELCAMSAE